MGVKQLLGKIANERGSKNEERALVACSHLSLGTLDWISEARLATKEEDKRGIDVVVTSDVGKLYIQVKSSKSGVSTFKKSKSTKALIGIVNANCNDMTLKRRVQIALMDLRMTVILKKR